MRAEQSGEQVSRPGKKMTFDYISLDLHLYDLTSLLVLSLSWYLFIPLPSLSPIFTDFGSHGCLGPCYRENGGNSDKSGFANPQYLEQNAITAGHDERSCL